MKTTPLLSFLFILLYFSCLQQKDNNDYAEFEYNSEDYYENKPFENNNSGIKFNEQKIKGYPVISKQFGMPVGTMPIPKSWNKSDRKKENILFESEDGVKVYGEQFASFYFSNNQEQNYYAQQGGSNIKPIKSIDRVINEDFKPYLNSKGIKFLGQFPLPELARFDKRFDSYLFKSTPEL